MRTVPRIPSSSQRASARATISGAAPRARAEGLAGGGDAERQHVGRCAIRLERPEQLRGAVCALRLLEHESDPSLAPALRGELVPLATKLHGPITLTLQWRRSRS